MKNKGFTLIEVLICFVIIAIAATIAIPSWKMIGDSALKADSRSLINDIRYVKEQTVNTHSEYKIVLYKDKYEINDSSQKIIKTYKFKRGVFLEDSELNRGPLKVNYMSYTTDGNASASGTLVISNIDGSSKMSITIVPVTGRALLTKL